MQPIYKLFFLITRPLNSKRIIILYLKTPTFVITNFTILQKYLLIILSVGVCYSENLAFINSNDTIVFKYKDLININQEKFRFLNRDGEILYLTKETMFRSDTVKMNVNNIESFQSYERYRFSNALDKSKILSNYLGSASAILGFWASLALDVRNDYKFISAFFVSGYSGIYGASVGYFYGSIYGFLSYGEGEMNFVKNGNWEIK